VLPDGRRGRAVWIAYVPQLEDETDPFAERVVARGEAERAGLRHATLLVARGAETLEEAILWIYLSHLTVSVLVAATALAVVFTMLRRGLSPLASLAEQVGRMDESSLDGRIQLPGADSELKLIVDRLNDSYTRLRQAFERERRFSSDVAHELRTPLAELRNLAEVGGRFAGEPAERERFFSNIVAVSARLDSLVGRLLDLSRSEAGATPVCLRSVALDELVDEVTSLLSPTIERRRLTMVLSIPRGRTVRTDPDHLEILVLNLLENAVDYAPEGSEIRITAPESSADPTLFEVTNLAPHLEASDLIDMFERLWRKDPARGDRRHSGLGLALAQAVGQRLALKIDARLDPTGLLTLRVASAAT
jgi:two-component system sensor histidine kinase QseC